MKILFISAVFENDATGASRFAKLIHSESRGSFSILSEDTKGGDRIIQVTETPSFLKSKLWQYFRIPFYTTRIHEHEEEFDAFVFNNAILAYRIKTDKPCFALIHDEKLINLKPSFRFDFIRRIILRRIEKSVTKSGMQIISNSEHISNQLVERYNVNPAHISLLYQGITLTNKKEIKSIAMEEPIKIIFVKNDYIIGGLPDLLQALDLLSEYRFVVSIIGNKELNQISTSETENVEFRNLGLVSNDEVINHMYSHDILCIPARYEPLGVAVMEGLAVGIPTITTGVGGLPEVTENGKHVWQCEPNNPQSIADQIKLCIENSKLRKQKSESGRLYVHDKFDFKNVESRLMEIISSKVKP